MPSKLSEKALEAMSFGKVIAKSVFDEHDVYVEHKGQVWLFGKGSNKGDTHSFIENVKRGKTRARLI